MDVIGIKKLRAHVDWRADFVDNLFYSVAILFLRHKTVLKNTDVEQVCLVGMGIPQPIALVITSEGGNNKDRHELVKSLEASIHSLNPSLEKHEKIEKIVVMKEEWSIENGLLTPTLKVKRNQVEKIHMGFYKSWFESKDTVIFE